MTQRTLKMIAGLIAAAVAVGCILSIIDHADGTESPTTPPTDSTSAALSTPPAAASTGAGAPGVGEPDSLKSDSTAPGRELLPDSPTAPSVAMPTMSLLGHLTQRAERLPWGNGSDVERQYANASDVGVVCKSQLYNPAAKNVPEDKRESLRTIAAHHAKLVKPATIEEGRLRKQAILGSLTRGSFESVKVPSPKNPLDPEDLRSASEEGSRLTEDVLGRLSQGRGKIGKDWIYTTMSSSQPDGIRRNNIITMTRDDHPDYFAALDQLRALESARDSELRAFFKAL